MKWELDLDIDAIYISVTDEPVASQQELPSGVVVDLDAAGRLRGVEVLAVSTGWDAEEVLRGYELSPIDQASLRYLATTPPPKLRSRVDRGSFYVFSEANSDEITDVSAQTLAAIPA